MVNSTSWLHHAQILDSALPIGAFSHSFGVESLVAQDKIRGANDLQAFLLTALHGAWSTSDALEVKGVYTLNEARAWELDALLHASRVSRETRDGMLKMGRQGLKLGKAIYPHLVWAPLEDAVRSGACPGSWPVVYGFWTRELGIDLDRAATGYLYGCCAATLNGAVRLSIVGQTAAQSLLAALAPSIEKAWQNASKRDPFDFSSSLPVLEVAQIQHEWLDYRLFMS